MSDLMFGLELGLRKKTSKSIWKLYNMVSTINFIKLLKVQRTIARISIEQSGFKDTKEKSDWMAYLLFCFRWMHSNALEVRVVCKYM